MPRIIFLVRGVDERVDLLLVGDEGEEPAAVRCNSVTVEWWGLLTPGQRGRLSSAACRPADGGCPTAAPARPGPSCTTVTLSALTYGVTTSPVKGSQYEVTVVLCETDDSALCAGPPQPAYCDCRVSTLHSSGVHRQPCCTPVRHCY